MTSPILETSTLLEKLEALRTELADLAFQLEHRGRIDAADLAIAISTRLAELREENSSREPPCLFAP